MRKKYFVALRKAGNNAIDLDVLSPGQFDQQLYLVGLKLAAGAQRKYNFIQCTSFYCCAIWKLWHNQVFEKADKTCFSCRTQNSFTTI